MVENVDKAVTLLEDLKDESGEIDPLKMDALDQLMTVKRSALEQQYDAGREKKKKKHRHSSKKEEEEASESDSN